MGSDILVLLGLCLLAIGCWLVYIPAAFIVTGILILVAGIFAWRKEAGIAGEASSNF